MFYFTLLLFCSVVLVDYGKAQHPHYLANGEYYQDAIIHRLMQYSAYFNYWRQYQHGFIPYYGTSEYCDDPMESETYRIEGRTFKNQRVDSSSSKLMYYPFLNLLNKRLKKPSEKKIVSSTFKNCISPLTTKFGICVSELFCSENRGHKSGPCDAPGNVCCINTINACDRTATLNNTYWESPLETFTSTSYCSLSLKLDSELQEQNTEICQVRLDFISFSIGQPKDGDCSDTFRVKGSSDDKLRICGDNTGQHVYIQVDPSDRISRDLHLIFDFGEKFAHRSWHMKIAMLPCGASYLAPPDCLQYFTTSSGRLKSFNWKEVGTNETRQINKQNYNICFRDEKIGSRRASRICLSVCPSTVPLTNSFSLTYGSTFNVSRSNSGTSPDGCKTSYIHISNGRYSDSGTDRSTADRFCGTALNPGVDENVNVEVCSEVKPFIIQYHTTDLETNKIKQDYFNKGFCLDFKQLHF